MKSSRNTSKSKGTPLTTANKIKGVPFDFVVGVDEAGRGPLAGPVAVGVVLVPVDFDWSQLPGVTDSKQLSEKRRAEIFALAKTLKQEGKLDYAVAQVGAATIDRVGIVPAVRLAMARALKRLGADPTKISVKLDGGLVAPTQYMYQETIIKGDSKEKVIGLASVMAKVTRDRYMCRQAEKAPFKPYDFAIHKGYGTAKHRAVIIQKGLSREHRQSYCKNINFG